MEVSVVHVERGENSIGLDIGLISPALLSMMVVMALFTTFMTRPLLATICPKHVLERASGEGEAESVDLPARMQRDEGVVA
jgi:hypothetical protein